MFETQRRRIGRWILLQDWKQKQTRRQIGRWINRQDWEEIGVTAAGFLWLAIFFGSMFLVGAIEAGYFF